MRLETATDGVMKLALNESGLIDGDVVAAGQLRQGKAPSMAAMMTGVALVEILRPRRSKLLPRHFVLALTETEAFAFKASGGSSEDSSSVYYVNIREEVAARFPRDAITLTDLTDGDSSKGGTLTIGGESLPVARPNLNGDPNTDELLAVLAAQSPSG